MTLLHDSLRVTAATHPGRAAVISDGRTLSFAALDEASDRLAIALQRAGVERGDRVAAMLENTDGLLISIYGILKAGAAFVLIHPSAPASKLRALLGDSQPKALIAWRHLCATVREATAGLDGPRCIIWCGDGVTAVNDGQSMESILAVRSGALSDPRVAGDDVAAIIYTSGSTGDHKGVMLTHRNLVNTTGVIAGYLGNTPDDVVACALALTFSYGLCQALAGVWTGYTLLLERSFAFPFDVLKRMREHRATGLPAVPTIIARLLAILPRDDIDLSALRYITNAAAPLPPAHILRLRELLPHVRIFSMYGQTECTRTTFLDPGLIDRHPESVGRAIPNCDAFIVDQRGRRVGADTVGELVVRGPNVMRGYWNRPGETAAALRQGDVDGEKVLHTGDMFRADADGLLYFVARADDMFKCRGEKVSPREIENVLCQMPEVAEAAVIGVEDPFDGMAIKAVIVRREGAAAAAVSEQRIRRHCAAFLEPALMPKHIEFRDSLPKTESGKVRKRDLRASTT